jgi:MFS family permease
MIPGRYLLSKFGAAKEIFMGWLGRNTCALIMVSSAFFEGVPQILILTIGASGFYIFRSMGCVAIQPLLGEITKEKERGSYIAQAFLVFNAVSLVALGILIYIMRNGKTLELYQIIIFSGAICGYIASSFLLRIYESEVPRESARAPLMKSIKQNLSIPLFRKLLLANSSAFAVLAMTIPISMLAIKRGYGISDDNALIFVLIQYCGGIFFSFLGTQIMGHTGPRPLLLLSLSVLFIVCGMWMLAPDHYYFGYVFWIFLFSGAANMGVPMTLTNYFLNATESKDRVSASLVLAFTSGISAGLAGALIAGGLVKFLPVWTGETFFSYRVYFCIIVVFLIVTVLFVARLDKLSDWEFKKVMGLFVTPRDLLSLFFINRLNRAQNPEKEREHIYRLGSYHSGLSENSLVAALDSPRYGLRRQALLSLSQIPFGEKTEEALIREVEYNEFSTASIAASILGEHNCKSAIPALQKALASEDYFLQAECLLALVKLRYNVAYEKIVNIFTQNTNPRVLTLGAIALRRMKTPEAISALFGKLAQNDVQDKVKDEIMLCIAEMTGFADNYYRYLKTLDDAATEGHTSLLRDYLDSFSENIPPKSISKIREDYSKDIIDIPSVCNRVCELLSTFQDDVVCVEATKFIKACPASERSEKMMFLMIGIAYRKLR